MPTKLIILIALVVPSSMMLFSWRSKYNIIAILSLPLTFIAHIGGVLFLFDEATNDYFIKEENVELLSYVLIFGSAFYLFSFFIGYHRNTRIKSRIIVKISRTFDQNTYWVNNNKLIAFTILLSITACIFYIYSFNVMGFIPMFSDNPFEAKFMAGVYQEAYRPVAQYYRIALIISALANPLLIIIFISSKSKSIKSISLILLLFLVVLTAFTLRRSMLAISIVSMIMLFYSWYKDGKYFSLALFFYIFIYCFGSVLNSVFSYYFMNGEPFKLMDIVYGMPDIPDLLLFWDSFLNTNYSFSYGRTIYGALIPFQYEWNPATFTKLVIGASETAASGGFRLPYQVEGYYSFGWLGVFFWSIYYGYTNGITLYITKFVLSKKHNHFQQIYASFLSALLIDKAFNFVLKMNLDDIVYMAILSFLLILTSSRQSNYSIAS